MPYVCAFRKDRATFLSQRDRSTYGGEKYTIFIDLIAVQCQLVSTQVPTYKRKSTADWTMKCKMRTVCQDIPLLNIIYYFSVQVMLIL